jgi:hypothetical protein
MGLGVSANLDETLQEFWAESGQEIWTETAGVGVGVGIGISLSGTVNRVYGIDIPSINPDGWDWIDQIPHYTLSMDYNVTKCHLCRYRRADRT